MLERENILFFAARNGAISNLLWAIERFFQNGRMNVRANWSENSFSGPFIELDLVGKYEHPTRYIVIDRRTERADLPSDCVYRLKKISPGAYYGKREPKESAAFDELMGSDEFKKLIEQGIQACNYPFSTHNYSSF